MHFGKRRGCDRERRMQPVPVRARHVIEAAGADFGQKGVEFPEQPQTDGNDVV